MSQFGLGELACGEHHRAESDGTLRRGCVRDFDDGGVEGRPPEQAGPRLKRATLSDDFCSAGCGMEIETPIQVGLDR
jgi:hypothetical protein